MSQPQYGTSSPAPASAYNNFISPARSRRSHRSARSARSIAQSQGSATIISSISNLANTIIGAGALAFPSAFATMGIIPGVVSCAFCGITSFFGLYLLSRCATIVGRQPGHEMKKASFNEVAKIAFGKGWATRVFDLAIAIKCFGVSVSYLIICKTLLPQVFATLANIFRHPLSDDSLLLQQDFWLVASMIVIAPLSFLKTLDALRFTSQIALGTVVYLLIVVVSWYIFKGASPSRGEVVLARFSSNTLASFPVQIFAYTCSQNLFPIYNELKDKTQQRMNVVTGASIGLATAVYEALGVIGYLTFGSKVGSNIIAMYPPTSFPIALGRLGIVLLVGLSYPLQCLPCRICVYQMTSGIIKPKPEPSYDIPDSDEDSEAEAEEDPLVPKDDEEEEDVEDLAHGGAIEMRRWKFIGITMGILSLGFIIALLVDELEVVLGFVGSTGSTIISFILPGFFYFKLFRREAGLTKWFALALAIYGVAVMIFCLAFNILRLRSS
ncbi:vacuolar amino acid transporter 5 [Tremella mesenterica]|uniref:Vacuolar amino acid transporter 5 n=1 Tax=Tremella mesenterica TaxID=5217 RepID=A0A4Q1BIY9_TREME|nr:vacuolar amino acid transporter 5 [Tremella mesenterica]